MAVHKEIGRKPNGMGGVQTFMWMCEDNIVEVPFGKEHLFEQILSPSNLSRTIKDGRAVSLIHKYLL